MGRWSGTHSNKIMNCIIFFLKKILQFTALFNIWNIWNSWETTQHSFIKVPRTTLPYFTSELLVLNKHLNSKILWHFKLGRNITKMIWTRIKIPKSSHSRNTIWALFEHNFMFKEKNGSFLLTWPWIASNKLVPPLGTLLFATNP